jgi:hypothetical protein
MSAFIGIRELARIVLPRDKIGGGLCMLTAHFDDSGTHDDSDVVVFGCFVGSENDWSPFEHAWKARLHEPLPGKPTLQKFHMTDCVNRRGEFFNYSDPEVDEVIKAFRDIILTHNLYGHAVAVSIRDWRELIKGCHELMFGTSERFCIWECLTFAAQWAIDNDSDKMVTVIFDDGPQHISNTRSLAEVFKLMHDGSDDRAQLLGPSFLPVRKIVPLQAADMLAWEPTLTRAVGSRSQKRRSAFIISVSLRAVECQQNFMTTR